MGSQGGVRRRADVGEGLTGAPPPGGELQPAGRRRAGDQRLLSGQEAGQARVDHRRTEPDSPPRSSGETHGIKGATNDIFSRPLHVSSPLIVVVEMFGHLRFALAAFKFAFIALMLALPGFSLAIGFTGIPSGLSGA